MQVRRPASGSERERLSEILSETDGRVFCDEELAEHLVRIAASEDDLPVEQAT
jgi:hypothetical protein